MLRYITSAYAIFERIHNIMTGFGALLLRWCVQLAEKQAEVGFVIETTAAKSPSIIKVVEYPSSSHIGSFRSSLPQDLRKLFESVLHTCMHALFSKRSCRAPSHSIVCAARPQRKMASSLLNK